MEMTRSTLMPALAALAALAACQTPVAAEPGVFAGELQAGQSETRLVVSERSFTETNRHLMAALEARGLTVFAIIDHAENARQAGLSLAPTTLYVFGNPQAGTAFIDADARMGLDLPLRMVVFERGGEVMIGYPDIRGVALSYGLNLGEVPADGVADTLNAIAEAAAFDRDATTTDTR